MQIGGSYGAAHNQAKFAGLQNQAVRAALNNAKHVITRDSDDELKKIPPPTMPDHHGVGLKFRANA